MKRLEVLGSQVWTETDPHAPEPLRVTLVKPVPPYETPLPLLVLMDGEGFLHSAIDATRTMRALANLALRPVAIASVMREAGDFASYLSLRYRDFTPSTAPLPDWVARQAPGSHGTGGAPRLLEALVDVVLPAIRERLDIDPEEIGIAGSSMSGLFASYAWCERTDVFSHLLAVSPALMWDDRMLLHRQLVARPSRHRVFIGVGAHEEGDMFGFPPGNADPSAGGQVMVSDAAAWADRVRATGATSKLVVFEDEYHITVLPAATARGVRHLYYEG